MKKLLASILAALLCVSEVAYAANLTPPNLTSATSLNSGDLLLVWPTGPGGPLEAITWTTFKAQLGTAAVQNTGTSGANVPLLNGANTWSGAQTYSVNPSISGAAGTYRGLQLQTAGVNRWTLDANTTAESGADAGSDLDLYAVSDDGATSTLALRVARATGLWRLPAYTAGIMQTDGSGNVTTMGHATGSWTPAVGFSTPGTFSAIYSTQIGYYTCIGDLVFVDFQAVFIPTLGTASGAFEIGPLPYAVAAAAQQVDGGSLSTLGSAFVGYSGALLIRPADATHLAFLYASPSAGGATSFTPANLTSGAPHIIGGSITYRTSATC